MIEVTVAICTRNRSASLRRTLQSVMAMQVPHALQWECLVIDNASTDDTAATAASFVPALPLRCVREAEPGLSHARNRAVAEARGTYICWTDDDVDVSSGWLAAYVRAFSSRPDTSFFGGPVVPVIEGKPPRWFQRNLAVLSTLTASRDFGTEPTDFAVAGNKLPYGANFALRTEVQHRYPYDPNLGAAPGRRRVGEETAVLVAICLDGGAGLWVPEAGVRHRISADRLNPDHVKAYQEAVGETWVYLSVMGKPNFIGKSLQMDRRAIIGTPAWLWRKAAVHRVLASLLGLTGRSDAWLYHWRGYGYYAGAVRFCVRRWWLAHRAPPR